jgi:hypothetical protein
MGSGAADPCPSSGALLKSADISIGWVTILAAHFTVMGTMLGSDDLSASRLRSMRR